MWFARWLFCTHLFTIPKKSPPSSKFCMKPWPAYQCGHDEQYNCTELANDISFFCDTECTCMLFRNYKQAWPSAALASLRTLRPMAGLSALYLEYWLLSSTIFTICHCLSSTIYLSLPGKNEHRLVLFAGKSKHLFDTCFTSTNFYVHGHRSKYIRKHAHVVSVSVMNIHTYAWTQPTNISIDRLYTHSLDHSHPFVHVCTHYTYYMHTQKQPIPYWLYKLHGLNVTYTCEICGNATYRGPKAFQRHFSVSSWSCVVQLATCMTMLHEVFIHACSLIPRPMPVLFTRSKVTGPGN